MNDFVNVAPKYVLSLDMVAVLANLCFPYEALLIKLTESLPLAAVCFFLVTQVG